MIRCSLMDFLSSWIVVQSRLSERSKPAVEKFYNILALSKTAMKKTYFSHTFIPYILFLSSQRIPNYSQTSLTSVYKVLIRPREQRRVVLLGYRSRPIHPERQLEHQMKDAGLFDQRRATMNELGNCF